MKLKSRSEYLKTLAKDPIVKEIKQYLKNTENKYNPVDPEYGGRLALEQALFSYLSGNYGVGAALLVIKPTSIKIFFGQNKIVTGKPSERFDGHAENGAIKAWLGFIERKTKPATELKVHTGTSGFFLYANLEPCPKCEMEITNLKPLVIEYLNPQAIIHSVSITTDGDLKKIENVDCATGSAHALGRKSLTSPLVWRSIQRGYFSGEKPVQHRPVQFSLLNNSDKSLQGYTPQGMYVHTNDRDLVKLSWGIFHKTRIKIDHFLATISKL